MIHVIGIGPGRPEWVPQATYEVIKQCDFVIGSTRALQLFPDLQKGSFHLLGDLGQSIKLISGLLANREVVGVLVSGDPGFFSFLPALRREFPEEEIIAHPGVSSLQLAFARAGIPWQDASFISVHGRELSSLPNTISKPTAVLTGGENSPQKVAQFLLEQGINPKISVGNSLGYPDEIWETLEAKQLSAYPVQLKNAIMIIYPVDPNNTLHTKKFKIGIPDSEFIRGKVPMTKSEIRVQVLAKARISLSDRILDVGAGTGSISIEAAILAQEGIIYAVENNPEAQELILANLQKFGINNLKLIPGTAPEIFSEIPPVNVCIIGGSKGRLFDILEKIPLVKGGRLVMTAVTLENVIKGLEALEQLNYSEIETISLQVVRWPMIQSLHMAQALNQVFIISALKGGKTG